MAVSALGACGSSSPPASKPLAAAPEPAVSPPVGPGLPGRILALRGAPEGVAITASGVVGVNVRQPNGLVTFPITDPNTRQTVPLSGSARHLTLRGAQGPFLVPQESDDRFVEVDPATNRVVTSIAVGRQPHDAIAVGSGFFVADELANTVHVIKGGKVTRVVPAPLQPGGMAENADGTRAIVVGVRGRRVSEYKADGTLVGTANCGAGSTHAVTGDGGVDWVADTNGGAVLGFKLTDSGPKQVATVKVGPQPYGLAYDGRRHTLWVTITGSNQLVGLGLNGSKVTKTTTVKTVRQPNTVAVDEATGQVVVTGSTTPGFLQLIG